MPQRKSYSFVNHAEKMPWKAGSLAKEENVWVLFKLEKGIRWYVARSGSEGSYTRMLDRAEVFQSEDAARRNACGNEYARRVEDILDGRA